MNISMHKGILAAFLAVLLAFPGAALSAGTDQRLKEYSIDSLLSSMSRTEIAYYQQNFAYAMEHAKPDETFKWKATYSQGSFTPGAINVTNNTICRPYREMLAVHEKYGVSKEYKGCKRVGSEGWCRLKITDFNSCALETPSNDIELLGRDVSEAFDSANHKTDSFFYRWWPF